MYLFFSITYLVYPYAYMHTCKILCQFQSVIFPHTWVLMISARYSDVRAMSKQADAAS